MKKEFADKLAEAKEHYSFGQFEEAADIFLPLAEQGIAEAQNYIATCYYYGQGVYANKGSAFKWFSKAAEQGDADSQYRVGHCYSRGEGVMQDKAKAAEWYRKAAKQGHDIAKFNLRRSKSAVIFFENLGFEDIAQPAAYTTMYTPMSLLVSTAITACVVFLAILFLPLKTAVAAAIAIFIPTFMAFRYLNVKLRVITIIIAVICLAIGVYTLVLRSSVQVENSVIEEAAFMPQKILKERSNK